MTERAKQSFGIYASCPFTFHCYWDRSDGAVHVLMVHCRWRRSWQWLGPARCVDRSRYGSSSLPSSAGVFSSCSSSSFSGKYETFF